MTPLREPSHQPAEQHAAYRQSRRNITGIVAAPDAAARTVPACPDWSVRDLVGHLVHICESFVAQEESQIDLRPPEGVTAAELLERWDGLDAALGTALESAPELRRRILLLDVLAHESDLRMCFAGTATPVDHPAFAGSIDLATLGLGLAVGGHALPALRIETPQRAWTVGEGDPVATVSGPPFDVFRSLTGRRTLRQIESLKWSGERCATWTKAFNWGPFRVPGAEVEQACGC